MQPDQLALLVTGPILATLAVWALTALIGLVSGFLVGLAVHCLSVDSIELGEVLLFVIMAIADFFCAYNAWTTTDLLSQGSMEFVLSVAWTMAACLFVTVLGLCFLIRHARDMPTSNEDVPSTWQGTAPSTGT